MSDFFGFGEADLRLPEGRKPTAEDIHRLHLFVARQTRQPGSVGTLQTSLPWGTITRYTGGGGGGGTAPFFAPSIEGRADGAFAVTWQKGTIGGIEPVVPVDADDAGGTPISGTDTVELPRFVIGADKFNADGEALIFFELQITEGSWNVRRIVPVAAPDYLAEESWKARKLALVLRRDGSFWRAIYSNQGWIAVNRRSNGRALHFFWGKY